MRWSDRHVQVMNAIAQARPGGVLFHCGRGYDRTGIIAMLLLAFVGVDPEAIVKDYELSLDPFRDELLRNKGTSSREVILDTLARLDARAYLLAGGMRASDLEALSTRILEPDCRLG